MPERDPLALAKRYGPYVALLVVAAFMLWVRLIPIDRVITDAGVFYSGNDPWYHNRMVHYAVRYFPETTSFDPWSYFPYGTGRHSGFGGLFDQLIALAALVLGAGDPSARLVDEIVAVAPPVFGALTAIPTYLLARRLTDRWWAVVAAVLLALSGGGILSRTIVGAADHQSAEAFFGAMAVAGFAYAVATAYRESPMFEDVQDRNWRYLRESVIAGVIGGVAVAAYLAMWPPGVMLLFTFGVFVVVQLTREHRGGRPTDPLAIATVVSMATAGVLTLLYARTYELSSTAFSLLQPLVAFGLALGAVVLLWLSRYAEREGYDRNHYPTAVLGLIVASLAVAWLVFPVAIDMLEDLFVRVYSFGFFTSVTAGTVAEIQPARPADAFRAYGTILVLAVTGFVLLAYRVYRESRPVDLLVLLWTLTMFSAYFTMARFGYYFSVNVALMGGFAVWWIADRWLELDFDVDRDRLRNPDVNAYQVIGVLVIVMLVVPGSVVAIGDQRPVWEQAESPALSGTDQAWQEGLTWMQENTPEEPLDYYAQYERPADGDYDYPEGAYGVMSWWDYGHWITVTGERIPYANPFQESPRPASAYFQATDETRANLILDAMPSLADDPNRVTAMSNDELRDVVDQQSEQEASEDGRYVVIDDQMAGSKFGAITQWTGPAPREYFQQRPIQINGENATLPTTNDRYEETMLGTLYLDDASGLSHYRLVDEVDRYSLVGGYIQGQQLRQLFDFRLPGGFQTWESAQENDLPASVQQTRQAGQALPLGGSLYVYDAHLESSVKTYERVEGARLTGQVPDANESTQVFATLQLQTDTGRNFTYQQQTTTDADGSFTMTVPYATDDTVGPSEGGTDTSVRATGDYVVRVGHPVLSPVGGSASVPESAVYEGQAVEVDIERPEGNETEPAENESTEPSSETVETVAISAGP